MSYLYVPDMEASDLDSKSQCQLLAPSVSWRGKLRAAPLWLRGCKRDFWLRHLFGQTLQPSTASRGVESWISLLRESRASLGVSPESKPGSRTSATLAKNSSVSLARWSQALSLWKTCGDLFEQDFPISSGAWPISGSMRNGTCLARHRSAPLISANDSSCWPTAAARDYKGSSKIGARDRTSGALDEAAEQLWGTPEAHERTFSPRVSTGTQRSFLANQAFAHRSPPAPQETGAESLKSSTQQGQRLLSNEERKLNPTFVEWLMGLPEGWTGSGCSATELCRWLQLMRSILYSGGSRND